MSDSDTQIIGTILIDWAAISSTAKFDQTRNPLDGENKVTERHLIPQQDNYIDNKFQVS